MDNYTRRYRGQLRLTPEQGGRFHEPVGPDAATVALIRAQDPKTAGSPAGYVLKPIQNGTKGLKPGHRVRILPSRLEVGGDVLDIQRSIGRLGTIRGTQSVSNPDMIWLVFVEGVNYIGMRDCDLEYVPSIGDEVRYRSFCLGRSFEENYTGKVDRAGGEGGWHVRTEKGTTFFAQELLPKDAP